MTVNKVTLTEILLKEAGITVTPDSLRIYIRRFWVNYRLNTQGSLRLTTEGFMFAKKYMKFHTIILTAPYEQTAKNVIRLDRLIRGPYYLESNRIYLSNTQEAVELILYNGDLNAYIKARLRITRKIDRFSALPKLEK